MFKTKKEFQAYFNAEIMPLIRAEEHQYKTGRYFVDVPLRREAWNNEIDLLLRDGMLPKSAENWANPF